jgi:hypothetical protein
LTPASFDLTGDPPTVYLKPAYAKNRKKAEQPLPAELAEALGKYLLGKPANSPAWPGTWRDTAAAMLRLDLAEAREKWLQSFHDARQRDRMDRSDFDLL